MYKWWFLYPSYSVGILQVPIRSCQSFNLVWIPQNAVGASIPSAASGSDSATGGSGTTATQRLRKSWYTCAVAKAEDAVRLIDCFIGIKLENNQLILVGGFNHFNPSEKY